MGPRIGSQQRSTYEERTSSAGIRSVGSIQLITRIRGGRWDGSRWSLVLPWSVSVWRATARLWTARLAVDLARDLPGPREALVFGGWCRLAAPYAPVAQNG